MSDASSEFFQSVSSFQMPPENQTPSPGQPFSLNTDRQVSTIPKAIVKEGEGQFWIYPSQQVIFRQFFLLLRIK